MPTINSSAKTSSSGPIMAMMKLLEVREKQGINDIAFAAGLPDHEVPREIKEALSAMAEADRSPYSKYDPTSAWSEETLRPGIAAFHERHFGFKFPEAQVGISLGSTTALDAVASITQRAESKALVIDPFYPLVSLPVKRYGGTVDNSTKLFTEIDVEDGAPRQSKRWQLNMVSLWDALENNRESATMLYLNFPSNPTGYSPTPEEYQQIANILADDIMMRRELGLGSIVILEDIAYATMMHDGKKFYGINNAVHDLLEKTTDPERREILQELAESSVTAHSFSKAFAIAGDRVAYYASAGKELFAAVNTKLAEVVLTQPRGTLAAMKGALDIGDVNHNSMQEYSHRLRAFERGFNAVTEKWMVSKQPKEVDVASKGFMCFVRRKLPVQAEADAGFFSTAMVKLLIGLAIKPETVEKLESQISLIEKESIRRELDGIFADGKINDARDAALWLLAEANVGAVPLTNGRLRFSVGQTDGESIKEALSRIDKALMENIAPPSYARAML